MDHMPPGATRPPPYVLVWVSPRRRSILRVVLLVLLVAAGALAARLTPLGEELERLARAIGDQARAPWAPPAFVLLYAAALAVGIPGTVLTLVGGVAFGAALGLGLNLLGALLGATAAFYEGRTLARDAVRRLFGHHLAKLPDLSSPRTAFVTFLRLRLIPLVPFNALNFAAGLTATRWWPYLAGTALGIIPSTVAYTVFAAALAGGGARRAGAVWWIAAILGAAFLAGALPSLLKWRHGRRQGRGRGGVLPRPARSHLPDARDAGREGALP
jgi:uncharacterized membrane protein YdjX (TVP38/TMEM64 family)